MRGQYSRIILKHGLWLSILLHLLLLLSVSIVWFNQPPTSDDKLPSYLPSYVYPSQPTQEQNQMVSTQSTEQKEQDKNGLLKSKAIQSKEIRSEKLVRQPRQAAFTNKQTPIDISQRDNADPIHLIGENKIVKPLVKILANALSKHLFYPRSAADFNLTGVVLVGFVLHPEGYVTDAKVVKSSGAGVLDDAARTAVSAMSPVPNVEPYVKQPEFLVVGIIFG
ncbi:MAG: hypothetical protein ACD_46C00103G0003 [uncultured bacterium]|nr:MAG: hypothetical protein ACD_46C00103G0003 [uncultured bacterium]